MSWSDGGDKNGKIMEGTSVNVTVEPGWELCENTAPAKAIQAVRVGSVDGKESSGDWIDGARDIEEDKK